jgi:hypothetical protein
MFFEEPYRTLVLLGGGAGIESAQISTYEPAELLSIHAAYGA